jgi:hypothetical protein
MGPQGDDPGSLIQGVASRYDGRGSARLPDDTIPKPI